jgi:hypothetical protein
LWTVEIPVGLQEEKPVEIKLRGTEQVAPKKKWKKLKKENLPKTSAKYCFCIAMRILRHGDIFSKQFLWQK